MITVLLPTYNNSAYIESSIESILNQTFKEFELLIIDDSSTDDTAAKIKEFHDDRIVLYENDENKGLGNTLNIGLNIAKHDIIARMDADDISLPERLAIQYNFMNDNKDIDVLSCHYAMMCNGKIRYTVKTHTEHADIKRRLILHSEIMHPGTMYNKDKIIKYGGYRDIYVEDYEMWLRMKDKIVFHNLPEILLIKRYHDKSISFNSQKRDDSVYSFTGKYYLNLQTEFGIKQNEENIYKGWREYFYGSKKSARKYFIKPISNLLKSPRVFAAYFITFLNDKNFLRFKELRLRFRLSYYLHYFSKENKKARKFSDIL
ncbi:MAG: glycosyltransferase [Ignavibacteria bacterium]|nr:glycosyltransferase [Ignavibacteria bacterium]